MHASKTALVLGGGGALGWVYHAGVVGAIEDMGADASTLGLIIGTSAGAAVAASIKAGADPQDIVEVMAKGPSPEQRERVVNGVRDAPKRLTPLSPDLTRRALRARANPVLALAGMLPRGWFPTAFTEQFPGIPDLAEWPDRLWIPAVRARDGGVVVFGRDRLDVDVADAVAASSAVPGMFQPKRIDGHDYIDGGVVSPTHADLALTDGVATVVISSPMTRPSRRFLARHARARLAEETTALGAAGVVVVVVEPSAELVDIARGFPSRNPSAAPAIAARARDDVAAACRRAGL